MKRLLPLLVAAAALETQKLPKVPKVLKISGGVNVANTMPSTCHVEDGLYAHNYTPHFWRIWGWLMFDALGEGAPQLERFSKWQLRVYMKSTDRLPLRIFQILFCYNIVISRLRSRMRPQVDHPQYCQKWALSGLYARSDVAKRTLW